MVTITIDGKTIQTAEEHTILQAAREAGIAIPTLCYLEHLNEIGACRLCVVEVVGMQRLIPSCNTKVQEGMQVFTNTEKVRTARKLNTELILSQHDCRCPSCSRSGNCILQSIANDLGILTSGYTKKVTNVPWSAAFPLQRDESRCVKCMRCIQVCNKVQSMGVWDVLNTGSRTRVGVSGNQQIETASCVLCGQCITHCPVGALRARDDSELVWQALADESKITIVQVAPAVRTAWAESAGLTREEATVEKLVAALRRMGFQYVFDTNFSADLTIMEEGSELVHRLQQTEGSKLPLFTSCCPGWVRFLKLSYPELVPQLSTAKSPQQMFGAVAKSYYAQLLQVAPEKIFCVSIMPCVAKKYESAVDAVNAQTDLRDVDAVLTTREMARMLKMANIDLCKLEEEPFDQPLGSGTGAAVIFGVTGGVLEAALRSAHYLVTGKNPAPDAFQMVRGNPGWREASVEFGGTTVRTAAVSGLHNARMLVDDLLQGKVQYDFVEVMACPGGCAGGGGQPIHEGCELAAERGEHLYQLDAQATLRFSHENPDVQKLYQDYFGKPLSEKAHHFLHTDQRTWKL